MKKILMIIAFLTIFFISCDKNKKTTDTDFSDEDSVKIDVDDIYDKDFEHDNGYEVEDDALNDPDNESENNEEISDDSDISDEDSIPELLRVYVKIDATGKDDGTSWEDAYTDLQEAINNASEKSEIWVAKGVYKPKTVVLDIPPTPQKGEEGYDRYRHFSLKNNLTVLGGFTGNETQKNQRNWKINETILSGDLDGSGDLSDKDAYHVMLNINIYETAVLDGFVITGGNANYELSPGIDLHPKQGGGINNRSTASPKIRNCTFKGNHAFIGGGAIANLSSHPEISDSIFENNTSSRGGAISNYSSSPYVQKTIFRNNSTNSGYGGAVFNSGKSRGFFVDCSFLNNSSLDAGAIANTVDSTITVSGCLFKENIAVNSGGAVTNAQSNPFFTKSVFEGNSAGIGGGAIENYSESSPRIANCTFIGNSVTGNGKGGAILFNSGIPIVVSSLFYNNSAYSGGAVANISSSGYFIGNTFFNNKATGQFGYGGGIFNQTNSSQKITNCIVWGNSSEYEGNQIYNQSSTPEISYSDIQDSFSGSEWNILLGTNIGGNISSEPSFVSSENGNFSLKSSSPCINKGSNSPYETGGIAVSFQEDIMGNPRISGTKTDIGAYEIQ